MTQEVYVSDTTEQNASEQSDDHKVDDPQDQAQERPQEGEQGDKQELSYDELKADRDRIRREAASRRTALREAEERLSKMKTQEDFESLRDELKQEWARAERNLIAENVALKFSLPDDLASRLAGETREELEADAKKLAQLLPGVGSGNPGGGLRPHEDDTEFDPVEQARKYSRANR